VAVGHIEDWTWEVTSRFLLSSELIASCWKEVCPQSSSQAASKAAYGLRRFVRSRSDFKGILEHVRNIARNPPGEDYESNGELEIRAHPHYDAEGELSEFYYALTVEKPFYHLPDAEDLTPDTEAGMAALQLQGGALGRTCQVVQMLLKTSLYTDTREVTQTEQTEPAAPLNAAVAAAAAATGYLPGESNINAAAAAGAGTSANGKAAAQQGISPGDMSDEEEDGFAFEMTVPRLPTVPKAKGVV
jgi:hypothetical protein